ncbi:MAG TPA: hypothetical protein VMF04_03965 [Thermoplasmata archaeon]|nr:hypothetical protein [Thermoplasmata archaeon]
MHALDLGPIIQAILFALFADLTAIITAVIGPTYDQLLVPELATSALYPSLSGAGGPNFLSVAAEFSAYVLVNIVDPAIALVGVGVAVLYLFRSFIERWSQAVESLLPRLVLAVVAANFTIPITGVVLDLGSGLYPVISGWDRGEWQQWINLAGFGQFSFSWDNGALAFVLSMVEFALVLGLVLAVGLRDALLAVLVVLLPMFTLLWPFRPLALLARRGWLLFVELVFLPCVMVVPLELAVGSPSSVLLVGYLGCALASPFLLSLAGTHLASFGFPGSSAVIGAGTQRGLGAAPGAAVAHAGPFTNANRTSGAARVAFASTARAAGTASAPAAAPIAIAHAAGQGAAHLFRHLRSAHESPGSRRNSPPFRGGGTA